MSEPQLDAYTYVNTARRYASAVYAVVVCSSVCLLQGDTVPAKRRIMQQGRTSPGTLSFLILKI